MTSLNNEKIDESEKLDPVLDDILYLLLLDL